MIRTLLLVVALGIMIGWPLSVLAADSVCVECHSGQSGALSEPVAQWRQSVHAQNGISCHDCHGGDPSDYAMAMSPERGFLGAPEYAQVPAFCGRCHVGVLEAYQPGGHGQALEAGGAQCVICHGEHAIQVANLELINQESCSRCHDYDRAEQIKELLQQVDGPIESLDKDLERLHRLSFATEEMESALFDLRNRFHRVFHGVDAERVRSDINGFSEELGQISDQVATLDETQSQRKLWGAVVTGLFVLAGVVLLLIRKTYEEEEKG